MSEHFGSTINITEISGYTIINCMSENLMMENEIDMWAIDVGDAISKAKVGAIINFREIFIMTSSIFRYLIFFRQQCEQMQIGLGISGLNDLNMREFHITCLDKAFTIGKTIESVVDQLQSTSK